MKKSSPSSATDPACRQAIPVGDDIDVWFFAIGSASSEDRALLAEAERARADRFRFVRDRDRFISGRAAMRGALGRYLDVEPASLAFVEGEPGAKPALAGADRVVFSFSRSGDRALLAVAAAGQLGADLEMLEERDIDGVAREQFSSREQAELDALPQPLRLEAFYRGWTAKEALVKATGEGLTDALREITVRLDPRLAARLEAGPAPYLPGDWRIESAKIGFGALHAVASLAKDGPIGAVRMFGDAEVSSGLWPLKTF